MLAAGVLPKRLVVGAVELAGAVVDALFEIPNPPNKLAAGFDASAAGPVAGAPNENPPVAGAGATLLAGAAAPNSPPGVVVPDPGALFEAEPAAGLAPNPPNPNPPVCPPAEPNAGAAPNAGAGGLLCGVVDPVAGAGLVEELPNEKAAMEGRKRKGNDEHDIETESGRGRVFSPFVVPKRRDLHQPCVAAQQDDELTGIAAAKHIVCRSSRIRRSTRRGIGVGVPKRKGYTHNQPMFTAYLCCTYP